jgi:hypothetical protein
VCSVGGWIQGLHLDTADTGAFLGSDLDVAFVTPGCSPGVTDDVVFFTTLSSVSDGGDGVVKTGSACSGVHDTAVVLLEDHLVSLDGNGNNTLVDGGFELADAVSWDVVVGGDLGLGTFLKGWVA